MKKTVILLVFTALNVVAAAQQNATSSASDSATERTVMQVCSPKIPQPCATAPRALKTPDPEYTEQARQAKIEGRVFLYVIVAPDGTTENIKVARSLDPGLNRKAVEAVREWKFKPGMYDGKPVAVHVNVEVNFRLR